MGRGKTPGHQQVVCSGARRGEGPKQADRVLFPMDRERVLTFFWPQMVLSADGAWGKKIPDFAKEKGHRRRKVRSSEVRG